MVNDMEAVLILDNIRSSENVGAIFRTADAAGIKEIFLCGVTPSPIDRFGREVSKIAKSALGAEKNVMWKYSLSTVSVLTTLKKKGFNLVALEQTENSIPYNSYEPRNKFALVLGNEVDGVSKKVLSKVDTVIEIPMVGKKESLNVSVAAGIALFRILHP